MKNSLFKKLFLTYGITMIIGFGILALLLLQLFNRYFIDSKKALLIEQGVKIKQEIAISVVTGGLNKQQLDYDLQILDKFLNAHIWLTNEQGIITVVSGAEERKHLGGKIEEYRMKALHRGESIIEQGNFAGKLKETSLTVGYPIIINNVFWGGVFIHAPMPEIQKTFNDIYKMTIWAILVSGIIAYGILYFQIKKISDPLQQISEAAKIIAGGEFHKRLKIHTHDEIQALSESFNHMAESLEKIEENRRNLVANISHDLRSPMTSIRGFIEGIVDGTIPEDRHKHYLEIVLEESKRLIKITNDLLELSNMQQGKVQINKTPFELNEVIRRKLIAFEQRITDKHLEVSLILHKQSSKVFADQIYTERVLSNLLDNAVKFTPEKGEIRIRTSDYQESVLVEVVNTGVAIQAEELRKVWERFHKGDTSRGRHKSGFGLGLAIVKEMVSLQEEKIWVESGSDYVKFSFTIKKV